MRLPVPTSDLSQQRRSPDVDSHSPWRSKYRALRPIVEQLGGETTQSSRLLSKVTFLPLGRRERNIRHFSVNLTLIP